MSKEVKTILESASRASARDLCPYSAENRTFTETEQQVIGSIVHDMCSRAIRILSKDFEDVFNNVINDYTEKLTRVGLDIGTAGVECLELFENFIGHNKIEKIFDNPECVFLVDGDPHPMVQEFERGGQNRKLLVKYLNKTKKNGFYGYPDLVLVHADGKVEIIDFKTGMTEDSPIQLKVYASIIFGMFPNIDHVETCYLYLRTRRLTPYSFTRKEIETFEKSRVREQNKIDKTEKADLERKMNKYCANCDHLEGCTASEKTVVQHQYKLVTIPQNEEEFTALAETYDKIKVAIKILEKMKEQAKETMLEKIALESGEFSAGEISYQRKETPARYDYDVDTAIELMEEYKIPPKEILTVGKTRAEKWLSKTKNENKKLIIEALEDGKILTSSRIEIVKKQRLLKIKDEN